MVGMFNGGLAQLARALALHARGHRFESDILHGTKSETIRNHSLTPRTIFLIEY